MISSHPPSIFCFLGSSFFLGFWYTLYRKWGKGPMPKNTERSPSRNQLTAALENQVRKQGATIWIQEKAIGPPPLENQIRKQEATIRTQEKAIGLLTKHDNGLAAFFDPFFKA